MTAAPGANAAPVAGGDAYNTDYETSLTVPAPGVLANDTDADVGTLTAGSASNPAGGSVTLNADGSFTYTPDAGFSGADSFTYTVTDDHGATDTGTVNITVGSPPSTPVADVAVSIADDPDPAGLRARVTYTVTVTNNGPDPASEVSVLNKVSGLKYVSAKAGTATVTSTVSTTSTDPVSTNNSDTETTTFFRM